MLFDKVLPVFFYPSQPLCSTVMKAGLMDTPTSHDVSLELEPAPPSSVIGRGRGVHTSLSDFQRTHCRSASWSIPDGQSPGRSEFGMGLAIGPLTNVIREIVPSFGSMSLRPNSNDNGSLRVSHDPSQTSLLLEPEDTEVQRTSLSEVQDSTSQENSLRSMGNSSSNTSVHLPHEHVAIPTWMHNTPEEQNVGLELSDSVRWLEQNAVFIMLLFIKFAWYHRSGGWLPLSYACI